MWKFIVTVTPWLIPKFWNCDSVLGLTLFKYLFHAATRTYTEPVVFHKRLKFFTMIAAKVRKCVSFPNLEHSTPMVSTSDFLTFSSQKTLYFIISPSFAIPHYYFLSTRYFSPFCSLVSHIICHVLFPFIVLCLFWPHSFYWFIFVTWHTF